MTEEEKRKPRPPDHADGLFFRKKGKRRSSSKKKMFHGKQTGKESPGKSSSGKNSSRKGGRKSPKELLKKSLGRIRTDVAEQLRAMDLKKEIVSNIPYFIIFYLVEKEAWLYRHCTGDSMIQKLMNLFLYFSLAFQNPLPSLHLWDIAIGVAGAAGFKTFIWYRMKNAKKFRQGEEYGSARWGTHKDIAPFIDPVFENNIILTATEFLTMNSRPKNWKVARNKNVIVIGGSGSGKTRNVIKPNLMQMGPKISYVLTDPKGYFWIGQ